MRLLFREARSLEGLQANRLTVLQSDRLTGLLQAC